MLVDDYGTVGYTQTEILEYLKINPNFDLTGLFLLDGESYERGRKETYLPLPEICQWNDRSYDLTSKDYHTEFQKHWLMPETYDNLDIISILRAKCQTNEELNRVNEELELFKKFDLLNLLKYLKYLRDIADDNHIVWGVGRGSSCASYCLFLLKIHKVNSLKFKLDISEFLRDSND